ncbi:RimK family alpha-L-glutamate ligase [Streptomyces nitrosporeus]|uniref:RimK family alpha-L-glutamate ligase n=1 Tax=Streptomyces nitrosporeus TaxID=28894 RepID=A0A5J6F3T9_9ACTN|nr:RimK family alpha-L-glutamate ligase [Streptomyces nitrosporeus]QEU70861.1 RimK family alpha-L-glutamate ligase [Streptomyces nitrosporeus]GGZ21255.1 30S ribosomal protein S6 modification protein [Streptomyces nitrosporeus]
MGAVRPVAVVADRIAWEERRLIEAAPAFGLRLDWVNDESLSLGHPDAPSVKGYDTLLVRSRSYTRGGLIATLAEAAGVPTLNTARAIHACENKAALRALLQAVGIPVPDHRLVLSRKDFDKALAELPLPLVLKPVFGGMGKRVTLIRDSDTAHSVYDYIEDLAHAFEQASVVEPYLGGSSVRCLVVGRELIGAAEFEAGGSDWRNNAALGNRTRAVAHDPDVLKTVDGVVDVLGPGIYGIDLFATPDGFVVNEVNHAPGFRAVASATGADVPSAIGRYVQELLS